MNRGTRARAGRLAAAVMAAGAALAVGAGAANAEMEVVYNNLPATMPGNVVSQPFEAAQMSQFGGAVTLAGTARKGGMVMVGMSSWACQKGSWTGTPECQTEKGAHFEYPITLRIYSVGPGGEVGTLLKSVTKVEKMPYRPSQNNMHCVDGEGHPTGGWWEMHKKLCFHGKYFKASFMVSKFTWPSQAIVSISYNTSDFGSEPQRPKPCNEESGGCFYDSLNVGLSEPGTETETPTVGSQPYPESAYQDSITPSNYCDGGAGGTGTFRLDAGCWTGYQPLLKIRPSI
jgi:hypothetical protein